jgi:hypothetical protein
MLGARADRFELIAQRMSSDELHYQLRTSGRLFGRQGKTKVLDGHGGDLAVYLAELDFALESETSTGWYNACFTRSVVEVLLRDAGLPPTALVASDWAEATDEEMRDVATRVPPLPADAIPRGMPEEHWWWFVASGPPEEIAYDY